METLDEFQSISTKYGKSSNLKYLTYYDLLINACGRYDGTRKANIGKQGHIYEAAAYSYDDGYCDKDPYPTPWGYPSHRIDTPSEEFYHINTTHASPPMSSRHKLRPRLPRPNSGPTRLPNNSLTQNAPTKKNTWTGTIYLPGHIYVILSQDVKDNQLL